jgi:ElaB/YqjD/DUF883 family membrane-anchored ribosome-binding protein
MAAVKLSITWLGIRKTLSPEQRAQAAERFGAEGEYLSAGKKLLDTRHPAFRAVTQVRHQIVAYWRTMTLPYPEPGIRLIKQPDITVFNERLSALRSELQAAVSVLDDHYSELQSAARQRLGRLFNLSDYPTTLRGLFDVCWEFPSLEPAESLLRLCPELYGQECERVRARFQEAVALAEQAFTEELSKLVSRLAERLSGSDDGKPKIFRDSAVENLSEFFQRFQQLSIGSDEELEALVDRAQRVLRGIEPQQLRDRTDLRQRIASQLSGVQSQLEGLLVDRPRRAILRPK